MQTRRSESVTDRLSISPPIRAGVCAAEFEDAIFVTVMVLLVLLFSKSAHLLDALLPPRLHRRMCTSKFLEMSMCTLAAPWYCSLTRMSSFTVTVRPSALTSLTVYVLPS